MNKIATAHRFARFRRLPCWALIAGGVLAAVPAAAQTPIKFTLDFRFEGPSAPFLVALDRGYYKSEGLDVTIEAAAGSIEPISRVATGGYDMGFGDINALIRLRDQRPGMPKPVFIVYNRPPFAILARKSRGIATPKDLEGKRLGAPAGDGAYAQWPVFVKTTGIDASKVTIDTIGFAVREPMLAAGQVDGIFGFSFSTLISVKARGVPVEDIIMLRMADHGVVLYGNAIMVNPKFAAEKPEAVKGFLRAFLKGLKDTVKDPAVAIDSVLKRNDAARRDIELERLNMAIADNILTPEVKANGYGEADADRLERAIDQIALTYSFKTRPKPEDVFDESFLPAAADRKVE